MKTRAQTLLTKNKTAYRASVEHLNQTELRIETAHSQLLYGEWLQQQNHRQNTRELLRSTHKTLTTINMETFAERTRHELLTTDETVHKRTPKTTNDLTT